MSRGGRFAKILEELWGSRGEVQTSSENYGFFRGRQLRGGHRAREGAACGRCSVLVCLRGHCSRQEKWWPVDPGAVFLPLVMRFFFYAAAA